MKLSAPFNFQFEIRNFQSNLKNLKLKIFFLFLASIFYFLFSPTLVSAQSYNNPTTVQQNQYTNPNTNPDVPKNLHTYTQSVMIEVMAAVSCQISGVDPLDPYHGCLGPDSNTRKLGYVGSGGGAIGFMGNMITMLYTPPLHTIDYIQNLAQNFGITKNAYARWDFEDDSSSTSPAPGSTGSGFQGLLPILIIWETFRNIVYILFVLVFVVIGVAIMLRVKIDPRTVMTIQNQIPKLIIGILIVTFSFAIAGFLIDIMWVAIYMVYGVFNGIQGTDVTSLNPSHLVGTTPVGAIGGIGGVGNIAYDGSGAIKGVITSLFDNPVGNTLGRIFGGLIGAGAGKGFGGLIGGLAGGILGTIVPGAGTAAGAGIGAGLGSVLGPWVGGLLGFAAGGSGTIGLLGGIIAFLIIAIALLWALIRLWFILLTAYIMVLIDVVFAPFWIVAGLVPGSTISFTGWLRSLVSNLAAFPATIVMFLLGKTFIDAFTTPASGQFVPPLIGNPGDIKSFGALIGLGIILTTPRVVNMMREALKAPKIDLSSIGAAVGAGASVVGAPVSIASRIGSQAVTYSLANMLTERFRRGREVKT